MTTPTPGQPLSEADVSLLQPGDWLRSAHQLHRVTNVHGVHIFLEHGVFTESEFAAAHFTFLGRPDQDGWIAWSGGENPVGEARVEIRLRNGCTSSEIAADIPWDHYLIADASEAREDIIAYRPHAPVSRPGDGVEWPAVTNVWAETYCELTGKNPDGQQVTVVDGGTVTTFRDMAKREIEAMLCAAPKAAVRAIAALTPPAEPVSRPAGEGEREAVARIIKERVSGPHFTDPALHAAMDQDRLIAADRIIALLSPAAPDADMDWQSVAMWMGFAASVIKSGESWSEQCQQHYDEACAAFDRLAALQPGGER